MKGDFSRYRLDAPKHYSAVLEQQGRVQLDSDANEQRAIDWHRLATETIDVIGTNGAPHHHPGFAISLSSNNTSLLIGAGRYYVNGLLCEAAEAVDYTQQRWLIGPQPGIDVLFADLRAGRSSAIQVWLEAWQRLATTIDDPCIKEPALGEADTTVRLQTVWRVVAEGVVAAPIAGQSGLLQAVSGLRQTLSAVQSTTRSPALNAAATHADTLANQIRAGTISGSRLRASLTSLHADATVVLPNLTLASSNTGAQLSELLATIGTIIPSIEIQDCCAAMRLPRLRPPAGEMTARTGDITDQGPCLPSPQAGYRGLENQLYRIEVHHGGPLAQATFKWSRDNGSVLASIIDISGAVLTVDTLGPDANLGFAPLQWVEISDDSDEFGQIPNQPGQLRQIKSVDFQHNRITLTSPAPAVNTRNGHAKIRRWDHTDPGATEAGVAMAPGGATGVWHSLENGIQVQFSATNSFQPSDYWLVPARTATGEVEWPPCDSDGDEYQPAHNTLVWRAPLACIDWEPNAGGLVPHDCREFFYPLTELTPPPAEAALHVTAINWPNDDLVALDWVQANGLIVTLDQPPASSIDPASFEVVLEAPVFIQGPSRDLAAAVLVGVSASPFVLRTGLILDGGVAVNGNTIVWTMPTRLISQFAQLVQLLEAFVGQRVFARARVTLKGRTIRGGGTGTSIYLDGQCFGAPGTRANSNTARTDLALPSGNAAKASDFESWFYLVPSQRVLSATVTPPQVAWIQVGAVGNVPSLRLIDPTSGTQAAVSPTLTFALAYNVPADTTVNLSVSGGTAGIVTVPSAVTVTRGSNAPAQAVAIEVGNTGSDTTELYTIMVSVPLAGGHASTATATLTVTGHTNGGIRFPSVFTGPTVLGNLTGSRNAPSAPGGDA